MSVEGVIVNGKLEFDRPLPFPEGSRVRVGLVSEFNVEFPFEPYDREKELALLRESIEDMKAGRGQPLEDVMAEISEEFNLPPVDPE